MAREDNAVRERGSSVGDLEEMAELERAAAKSGKDTEPTD